MIIMHEPLPFLFCFPQTVRLVDWTLMQFFPCNTLIPFIYSQSLTQVYRAESLSSSRLGFGSRRRPSCMVSNIDAFVMKQDERNSPGCRQVGKFKVGKN